MRKGRFFTLALVILLMMMVVGGCAQAGPFQAPSPSPSAAPAVSAADGQKAPSDDGAFEIVVGETRLPADFAGGAAADALKERLATRDVTVTLSEYGGFEKVGDLGFTLPASDESITAKAGDVVLYQGDKLSIIYGENTWSYTRLGTIHEAAGQSLRDVLGDGDVTVTLTRRR